MWLEDTISPSTSTSGTTRVSKRPSAGEHLGVARRAVPEAEVLAHRHARRLQALDQNVVDELLGALVRKAASNGITTRSSTPSLPISSALASRLVSSFGAASGRTTCSGCGSNVSTVSAAADHLAVSEVHAVELADGDPARARLDVGELVTCIGAEAYGRPLNRVGRRSA